MSIPGVGPRCRPRWRVASALAAVAVALSAQADEGGVSFWLPGQFGSLAALPAAPGWSITAISYHSSVSAAHTREFPLGGRVVGGLDARGDLLFVAPGYVFEQPLLGGQAAATLIGAYGRLRVDVGATLAGPGGGAISGAASDTLVSAGDLYALGSIKWNRGVHNALAYSMLGIPAGSYRAARLANLGTGHWSFDAGGGYTYFDERNEFSAVLGLTHNFENPDTAYRNGVAAHLDWGASRFVAEGTQLGLVGYFYRQLSGDRGAGARLGEFKSRVGGVGPQLGQFLPVAGRLWYLNLKGYWEFDAKNRPEGWNLWLTVAVPLGAPARP